MSLPAIISTARTLSYYTLLQDVTANNLANSNTDGFKGDRISAHSLAGDPHPVPARRVDMTQGTLRDTQRPYDLALQGAGFFVVKTADGAERLTRGGSFDVNPTTGELVDHGGNVLLGSGGPIVAGNGQLQVSPDGSVRVNGASAGQLRIETVADPSMLMKQGNGLFIPTTATEQVTGTGVHQGAVEDSNVSSIMGAYDLITIQRAYASGVDALRTMDSVMSTVTGDIGRVTP